LATAPFSPLLRHCGHHHLTGGVGEVARHHQPALGQTQHGQHPTPVLVGLRQQRSVVAAQDVEYDVLHRHPGDQVRGRLDHVHALLQQAEIRAAALIQGDQLTIDDQTGLKMQRGHLRVGT
jgi:hypothetical protein